MKLNKTIEKELNKIPDDIKEKYNINNYMPKVEKNEGLIIHTPSCINIMFDRKFTINNTEYTVDIINKTLCVSLWKKSYKMHTTIY